MRVHHYIKNLLVFGALICSGQFFDFEKLRSGILGFFAFCMVSSTVYVINDIKDADKDKHHPTKCQRPIASGAVSAKAACILACLLLLLAAVSNFCVYHLSSTLLLILYLLLNLAYSYGLKDIPLVDTAILSGGFLIRILYGAVITDIAVSNWLCLTVVVAALYFALGKRRNEAKLLGDGTRKVLSAYPPNFLDRSMNMCLTLANVFYSLWSMDAKTVSHYGNEHLVLTAPMVLFITLKYGLDIDGNSDGDPVEVLLHDKALLAMCAFYATTMFTILYIRR